MTVSHIYRRDAASEMAQQMKALHAWPGESERPETTQLSSDLSRVPHSPPYHTHVQDNYKYKILNNENLTDSNMEDVS